MVAIEVKAGRQFSDGSLRGLRAINDLRGVRRRIVVYGGERRMKTKDGIEVLPISAFLELLQAGTLF